MSKRLRQRFAGVTRSSFANAWLRGEEETANGPVVLTSAFQQSTWVYACITTLAENVSAIPFRVVGEGSGADAAAKLFAQPHRRMDRFAFWELVVQWLCLRGEVFILPVKSERGVYAASTSPEYGQRSGVNAAFREERGRLEELVILNPDQMREIVVGHELAGWNFTGSGANSPIPSTVLLPEEVIHIRLPNPFHLWRGMSPLAVAWLAVQTDYAAAQFMKGAMINNADTGLIVSLPKQPEAEQLEQLKGALRERKRAAGTADRPLVLFDGAKIEKPSVSAMELEFLENRKFNRQEICAIYKVPQELLGYTEDANRSVSEAARLNFVENRIAPLCKRLEAGIDPIVKMFGRELRGEFHVNATPIMQAAQRARIDSGLKLFGVGVPLNIVNQVLDLGLPDLTHGDRSFLSSRYQELPSSNPEGIAYTSPGLARSAYPGLPGASTINPERVKSTRTNRSREFFEQRCRTLDILDKGRPQIEAMIADAVLRGESQEFIARRVRAYFNQLTTTDNGQLTR